ncbi:MAG: tetratricopeptide repeat protein [Verrucomicrobiales bacterium]|nr:tetratricopeptide repeat protein [Verrucomicrobiales bacterium]
MAANDPLKEPGKTHDHQELGPDSLPASLAAVMFTDMVGYSRLMREDERRTLALLHRLESVAKPCFSRFHGRVIKTIGDSYLVAFPSAVSALQCALELQSALGAWNCREDPNQHLVLRIGIHLGEVIAVKGDLFGDDVNIAKRVEGMADPGGICITSPVRDQVSHRVTCRFKEKRGVQLKGIRNAPDVFGVVLDGRDPADSEANEIGRAPASAPGGAGPRQPRLGSKGVVRGLAGALAVLMGVFAIVWWTKRPGPTALPASGTGTSTPAIALLPLEIAGAQSVDAYLLRGLREDLLAELRRRSDVRVIGWNPPARLLGENRQTLEVAREAGIGRVVFGSISRQSDTIAVSLEVVPTGGLAGSIQVRTEVALAEVAAIPGRLATEMLSVLAGKTESVIRPSGPVMDSPEAYRLCLLGRFQARTGTSEGFTNALKCFERALEIRPGYPMAMVGLAHAYLSASDWLLPSATAFEKAKDHLLSAQSQAETIPDAVYLLAYVRWTGDWNQREAATLFQRAIDLDPRHYAYRLMHSRFLLSHRQFSAAHAELDRATELNPLDPAVFEQKANLLGAEGRFQEAVKLASETAGRFPESFDARIRLALALAGSGKTNDALKVLVESEKRQSTPDLAASKAFLLGRMGHREQAIELIDAMKQPKDGNHVASLYLVWAYAGIGEVDEALSRLEQSVAERSRDLVWLDVDPYYHPLKGNPRFEAVRRKIGLRE